MSTGRFAAARLRERNGNIDPTTNSDALTHPLLTRTGYPAKGPTLKLLLLLPPAQLAPQKSFRRRRRRLHAIVGSLFFLQPQSDVQD